MNIAPPDDITGIPIDSTIRCLISFGRNPDVYTFNYGAPLTGVIFKEIYVSRPPRSQKEEAWHNEQLRTRLTPNGKIIHG